MSLDRSNSTTPWQSLRTIVLAIITGFVLLNLIFSVIATGSQPQIQDKFQLYQTNLVLTAGDWQPDGEDANRSRQLKASLFGDNILQSSLAEYQKIDTHNRQAIDRLEQQLKGPEITAQEKKLSQRSLTQARIKTGQLELNLGVLTAVAGDPEGAVAIWNRADTMAGNPQIRDLAKSLTQIWQQPANTTPATIAQIESGLNGWFRDRVLSKIYTTQSDANALDRLNTQIQTASENAVVKLGVLSIGRILLGLTGVGLLVLVMIKSLTRINRRQASQSIVGTISPALDTPWETPWNWEITWQVVLIGFFVVGQFIVPALFGSLFRPHTQNLQAQALYIFSSYVTMAVLGITVMFFSIKSYLPLPPGWFNGIASIGGSTDKSNWLGWGVGGYLVAIPIVTIVSLLTDRLFKGQGGSNPLLEIVLEGKDRGAIGIFFLTAAVAAPLFEEFFFRGFLLPSLTRYLPVWAAILVSAIFFGVAHLSISEIPALTVLGILLGIVYTRTRDLRSSMLFHGLWNSGTLISLVVLGSGK
jgi:uncharacterized protein